jgi:hypothetical protein
MKRRHSAIAAAALALCVAGLTSTEASAQRPPEPGSGYRAPEYNYPEYELDMPAAPIDRVQVPVDDTGAEVLQAAASGLGGAAVAFGALWLYRRRHATAV